ncbi:MAG: hypothetical protein J2P50_20420 [Hyphomicrobiaceae bacterium]|nr:hypothetical protein [Hyphomicrobiaceae bacterium]
MSSQSEQQADETLPPGSIIPPTAPAAKADAAKSGASVKADAPKPESSADYLAQCLKDWDAATHMTRAQWARTCRRVATNRVRFMNDVGNK